MGDRWEVDSVLLGDAQVKGRGGWEPVGSRVDSAGREWILIRRCRVVSDPEAIGASDEVRLAAGWVQQVAYGDVFARPSGSPREPDGHEAAPGAAGIWRFVSVTPGAAAGCYDHALWLRWVRPVSP
jgi:hypothetical protein